MISYEANQNRIYQDDFRAAVHSLTEVQASPFVQEPTAGYIVAWLYPDTVMTAVAHFNGRIHEIVPAMRFGKDNAHTTITVYQRRPLSRLELNKQILLSLTAACNNLDRRLLRAVRIDFKEWLFNQEAVIAAGQPNDAFWQVGEELQKLGKAYGLKLRMPWGAHMTVARFLSTSDRVNDLIELTRQTPSLGQCQPRAIGVGHYECGPSTFHLSYFALKEIDSADSND